MDEPISPKLADAFFEAVRGYVRWGFIRPEPSVTDHQGELIPISAVCRRVDKFTDPLPDEVFDALYFLARQKHLKEKLDAERTYATGAQLLLKLIEDRKAKWAKRNTAPLRDRLYVASFAYTKPRNVRRPKPTPVRPSLLNGRSKIQPCDGE